jgi:hypothetical protein
MEASREQYSRRWLTSLQDIDVFSGANLPFHPNKDGENPLIKTFFPTVFSSPALLQGVLCITSTHLDAAEGRTSSDRRTLAYRGEAIRLIREGFQRPDQGISDGAIGTIMLLSSHEVWFNLAWRMSNSFHCYLTILLGVFW